MDNILSEYLVRLGFQTENESFRKMQGIMALAEQTVTVHTSGIARRLLEAQAAIGGGFLSLSAAILGVVDKAAMADQGFRLLGLRMLMSTDQARKMDMITKGLGVSLEQIVWDPELHQRAVVMGEDIDRMTKGLGPGFSDGMKSIRDFRFEFQRLGVAVQFLGFQFANDLWKKLNPGEAGKSVHDWVDWFQQKIPEFSDKLTNFAKPALEKTWQMAEKFGEMLKAGASAWINLIGLLSGDESLKGASFSFERLAKSIEHVGDWMIKFFLWMTQAESSLLHFATGIELLFEKKWTAAGREFKEGWAILTSPVPESAAPQRYGMEGRELYKNLTFTPGYIESRAESQFGTNEDLVSKLAAAIIRKEDSAVEGSVGFRNNNPGNLRNWEGFPESEGYAKFPDWDTGLDKLKKQIRTNIAKGLTLNEFFAGKSDVYGGYAPQKDGNDPRRYASDVSKWTGIDQTVPLNQLERSPKTSMTFEGGNQGYMDWVKNQKEGGIFSSDDPRDWLTGVGHEFDGMTHQFAEVIKNALKEGVSSWADGFWKDRFTFTGPTVGEVAKRGREKEIDNAGTWAKIFGLLTTIGGAGYHGGVGISQVAPDSPVNITDVVRWWFESSAKRPSPNVHLMGPMPAPDAPAATGDKPPVKPVAWLQPDSYPLAPDKDWAPVVAAMDRPPAMPQANVSHTQQHVSVDVGGIYITEPGADAAAIARVVGEKMREFASDQILGDLTQLSPAYSTSA